MEKIPSDILERIREETDIVSLIGSYVPLKKRGKNYVGSCPFHMEKTPSFTVTPEKKIFKCFGCGQGGDVFDFYREIEGVSFYEAAIALANRLGIILDHQPDSRASQKEQKKQRTALEITSFANQFFIEMFGNTHGQHAREYLLKRGFQTHIIEKFNIGYAGNRQDLVDGILKKQLSEDMAKEIGLLGVSTEGERYSVLAHRVTFPIRDTNGKIVGFGGRTLSQKATAKYLNSPQSFIYDKSSILYGFHAAKTSIRQKKTAVLVEGYLDVIACHQAGITEAVAPLGTSLTKQHVALLRKVAKKVVLAMDADHAGMEAMLKAARLLLKEGLVVNIVIWPSNSDPADLIKENNSELLSSYIEKSQHIIAVLIKRSVEKLLKIHKVKNPQEVESFEVQAVYRAISYIAPLLAAMPQGLQQELYRAQAAESYKITEEQLQKHLDHVAKEQQAQDKKELYKQRKMGPGSEKTSSQEDKKEFIPIQPVKKTVIPPPTFSEMEAARTLLSHVELRPYINDAIKLFQDERLKNLLTEFKRTNYVMTPDDMFEILDDRKLVSRLKIDIQEDVVDPEVTFQQLVAKLDLITQLKQELELIQDRIRQAEQLGSEIPVEDMKKKAELRRQLREIQEKRRE